MPIGSSKAGRFEEGKSSCSMSRKGRRRPGRRSQISTRSKAISEGRRCPRQGDRSGPTRHDEWFFSRADFLLELGDLKEAKRTLESIEVPAHRALIEARIASVEGNLDEAAKRFEEGIKLWPDNPDAHYLAGQVYERRGEWSLASAHYREAARMDKPHYESSLALADLQRALGDEGGVDFLLLRLADARPGDPKVAEKLIEHAVDTGNNELGMRSLRHLSQLPGQAGRAVALAAERAEVADGTEAALRVIDELKLDLSEPENFDALEARCELLARLERGSEGLASVEKALKRDPESARVLVLRAKIRRGEGDLEPAVADLEQRESCSRDTYRACSSSRGCVPSWASAMRPEPCTRTRPASNSTNARRAPPASSKEPLLSLVWTWQPANPTRDGRVCERSSRPTRVRERQRGSCSSRTWTLPNRVSSTTRSVPISHCEPPSSTGDRKRRTI